MRIYDHVACGTTMFCKWNDHFFEKKLSQKLDDTLKTTEKKEGDRKICSQFFRWWSKKKTPKRLARDEHCAYKNA